MQAGVPLQDLQGSYYTLKSEYRHCSPWWGAAWWHGGIIHNLYRLGGETGEIEGIHKLTKKLFHEVQGQINVTQNFTYPVAHITPKLLAKIIKYVEAEMIKGKKKKDAVHVAALKKLIKDDEDFKKTTDINKRPNFMKENYNKALQKLKKVIGNTTLEAYLLGHQAQAGKNVSKAVLGKELSDNKKAADFFKNLNQQAIKRLVSQQERIKIIDNDQADTWINDLNIFITKKESEFEGKKRVKDYKRHLKNIAAAKEKFKKLIYQENYATIKKNIQQKLVQNLAEEKNISKKDLYGSAETRKMLEAKALTKLEEEHTKILSAIRQALGKAEDGVKKRLENVMAVFSQETSKYQAIKEKTR